MREAIVPLVGMTGNFVLRNPFDALISENDVFTIQAVRSISEYMVNMKDPKATIYDKYGVSEEDWKIDFEQNHEIVSMQSEVGQWLHIPTRFISSYPLTNGVGYQSFTVAIALPAMPVDVEYDFLLEELQSVATSLLGVNSNTSKVETSRVALVDNETHRVTQAQRRDRKENAFTYRARLKQSEAKLESAIQKIQALETYIKENVL